MGQEQTFFERIGQYIVNNIEDNEWQKAFLFIDIVERSVGLRGEYVDSAGKEKSFDTAGDFQLAKSILDFWNVSNVNPGNKWNRTKATLTSEYEMTLEYFWDQQLADEVSAP